MCSLSDWERDVFENIVCNHFFNKVNHAELPHAVRKVLSHYMGNGDQSVNTAEDENTQQLVKKQRLSPVDPISTAAFGDYFANP